MNEIENLPDSPTMGGDRRTGNVNARASAVIASAAAAWAFAREVGDSAYFLVPGPVRQGWGLTCRRMRDGWDSLAEMRAALDGVDVLVDCVIGAAEKTAKTQVLIPTAATLGVVAILRGAVARRVRELSEGQTAATAATTTEANGATGGGNRAA